MKIRNTVIIVLAFIALAAYVYFAEWKKPAADEKATPTAVSIDILPNVEPGKVAAIAISRGDKLVKLEKRDEHWQFVVPENGGRADDATVKGGIAAVTLTHAHRSFGNVQDFAQYGLKKPRATIELTRQDGSKMTLLVGDKSVDGGSYYLQMQGKQQVYLAYCSAIDGILKWLNKPPYPPTPTPTPTETPTPSAGATPKPTTSTSSP